MDDVLNELPAIIDWLSNNWGSLTGVLAALAVLAADEKDTRLLGRFMGKIVIAFSGMKFERPVRWIDTKVIPQLRRATRTVDWLVEGWLEAYEQRKIQSGNEQP